MVERRISMRCSENWKRCTRNFLARSKYYLPLCLPGALIEIKNRLHLVVYKCNCKWHLGAIVQWQVVNNDTSGLFYKNTRKKGERVASWLKKVSLSRTGSCFGGLLFNKGDFGNLLKSDSPSKECSVADEPIGKDNVWEHVTIGRCQVERMNTFTIDAQFISDRVSDKWL